MTITETIKKALRAQGISESYAERVQKAFGVETETGAEAAVKAFKENILPAIEEAGKEAREKAAKEARKDAVAEYEKTHGLKDGKPNTPSPTDPIPQKPLPTGEINAALRDWIENQNKQLQELRAEINQSKAERTRAELQAEAKAAIQKAGLPDSWADRIRTDAETSIEEQVKTLSEEFTAIRQSAIDGLVGSGGTPPMPKEDAARSEKEWTELMMAGDNNAAANGTVSLTDSKGE